MFLMYIFSDTRGVVTAVGLFDVTGKYNISEKYNKKQKVINNSAIRKYHVQ